MTNTRYKVIPGLFCAAGLLLIVSMSGCSQDRVPPPGLPRLYQCVITLTQGGEPLAGAMVTLHTQGTSLDWTVNGKTDEKGVAIIFTDGYFRGAPAGEYKVTVDKLESVTPAMPDVLPTNPLELERLYNRLEAETKEYRYVEPIYVRVDSTPLSIAVDTRRTMASFDVGKPYRELAQ